MSRLVACTFTALLIAAPSMAIAQTPQPMQAQTEAKDLTDLRIAVVRHALELSPEQQKYWPAIEAAIRARADARRQRLQNIATRVGEDQPNRDFIKILQNHAKNLSERGTELKNLADAWEPLYVTLNDAQKQRMRVLARVVLHGVAARMEARHAQMMEMMEEEDASGAAMGPGSGESGMGR